MRRRLKNRRKLEESKGEGRNNNDYREEELKEKVREEEVKKQEGG